MKSSKEPEGIDFIINGKPLTDEEVKAISEFIKADKAKRNNEGTPTREVFNREAYTYYTGQIVEQARKDAGMTQSELADKIGTNESYISRVETGRTDPKVSTFYRIASALGLSVSLTSL